MATRNYQSTGRSWSRSRPSSPTSRSASGSSSRRGRSSPNAHPPATGSSTPAIWSACACRILKMQRDEYLLLKVIKERLLDQEASTTDASTPIADEAPEPADELAELPTAADVPRRDVGRHRHHRERIRELESFGLVSSHGPESARYYDGTTTSCCRSSRTSSASASSHGTSPCTGTSPSERRPSSSRRCRSLRHELRTPVARRWAR